MAWGIDLKKALKILGVVIVICAGLYMAYGAYVESKWGQYLPTTEITVNGVERKYHSFVPSGSPAGPMPLIVFLQGGNAGSYLLPQQSLFEQLAEQEGIILAMPVGKRLPHNEGAWQLNTDAQSMQDIDYVQAMINDISASHPVDQSRVYAIGYSLGSMFSYELACQMSTQFAAIASYAGTMPVSPKACDPERNVPIMHIHGAQDPIIAYDNSWDWKEWDSVGTMWDIPGLLQYWATKYNCQNENQTATDTSTHTVYDTCDQNARVEHHRIGDSGHGWPENINGVSTHDVIWTFLGNFSMPRQ